MLTIGVGCRRSITILVVLAFASLLLFTIVRHPTFSIESDEQNLGSETLADSTLSGKAAELPHDPNIKSSSNSLTQVVIPVVLFPPYTVYDADVVYRATRKQQTQWSSWWPSLHTQSLISRRILWGETRRVCLSIQDRWC